MSASVTYITRIAQVTLKTINNTLLIYNWWLCFFHIEFSFNFPAHKHRLDGGVYLSCLLTIFAEIWSINGKITRTVSSVSLAGDKIALNAVICMICYIFLDNGVMTTPKRRILSFGFTVL